MTFLLFKCAGKLHFVPLNRELFGCLLLFVLPFLQLIDFSLSLTRCLLLSFNRESLDSHCYLLTHGSADSLGVLYTYYWINAFVQPFSLEIFAVPLQAHLWFFRKERIFACFRLKRILLVVSFL